MSVPMYHQTQPINANVYSIPYGYEVCIELFIFNLNIYSDINLVVSCSYLPTSSNIIYSEKKSNQICFYSFFFFSKNGWLIHKTMISDQEWLL